MNKRAVYQSLINRWHRAARLPDSKADIGTYFQHTAARNINRTGFDAGRFGYVTRPAAVNGDNRCIARLAVVRGYRRGLLESVPAWLGIGARSQNDMAAWDLVRMEPPVIGLGDLGA